MGPLISDAMVGLTKITDLVTESVSLVKSCVKGDALEMLNETAQNLINFTSLEHRLVVNGINIARAVARATIAFEKHKFHKFGWQIGKALRKILLSTNNKQVKLPEGMPEDKIIADASEGIMAGFFAKGVGFFVTDAADPRVKFSVDLHQCIAGNRVFYRSIFEGLWTLFAQIAANKGQHMGEMNSQWVNELLLAMMRIPMVFTKCGVDPEVEEMMIEAMQTLGSLRVTFKFPDDKIKADKAADKVAEAVKAFTKGNFRKFGIELGKLFRELLLLALPEKYSVDSSGHLRRNLLGDVAVVNMKQEQQRFNFGYAMIFGGVALAITMSLVALKSMRVVVSWQRVSQVEEDVEVGDDEELEMLE